MFNGEKINIDYNNIPSVIYGTPEIAQVGATEQYLKSKGEEYKVSQLPLTISAKAYIDGELDGMVKILSQKNKIIGACVVADNASALLQQLVIAISMKLDVSELERVVFAHPTTSEAVLETLLNLDNKALYVPPKKV